MYILFIVLYLPGIALYFKNFMNLLKNNGVFLSPASLTCMRIRHADGVKRMCAAHLHTIHLYQKKEKG